MLIEPTLCISAVQDACCGKHYVVGNQEAITRSLSTDYSHEVRVGVSLVEAALLVFVEYFAHEAA